MQGLLKIKCHSQAGKFILSIVQASQSICRLLARLGWLYYILLQYHVMVIQVGCRWQQHHDSPSLHYKFCSIFHPHTTLQSLPGPACSWYHLAVNCSPASRCPRYIQDLVVYHLHNIKNMQDVVFSSVNKVNSVMAIVTWHHILYLKLVQLLLEHLLFQ